MKEKLKILIGEYRTLEPAKKLMLLIMVALVVYNVSVLYDEYRQPERQAKAAAARAKAPAVPTL